MENNLGYKTALKSTSLFGSVQLFRIITNIVKFKIVALILGPTGFGLIGIYNSIISLIQSITGLGIASSAVREISATVSLNDEEKRNKTIKSLTRWFLSTGILSAIVMVIFSPLISLLSFNNYDYLYAFVFLSLTVFFQIINGGQLAILQGLRRLNDLAKANLWGSLLGLIVSVPFFIFWGINGIIPSLIASALILFLVSNSFIRKLKLVFQDQTWKESFLIGKPALYLGISLSISAIAVYFVEVVLKAFITRVGGIEDVGFYQAGWTINTSYIGLVLTAMATDYFPRLSGIAKDNIQVKRMVTEQTEIAILILGPLVCIILSFLPIVIKLLYSYDFLAIISMTQLMLLGSLLKVSSWAISYIFLAKGDGKRFLMNELIINAVMISTMILGYEKFNLIGLGFAYVFTYLTYFTLVWVVAWKKYEFKYTDGYWKLFTKYHIGIIVIFILIFTLGYTIWGYVSTISITALISLTALADLNKRVNLKTFFKRIAK